MVSSTTQCANCQRSPMGRCLSHTTLPFGQYGPQTFTQSVEGGHKRWGYRPAAKGDRICIPAKTFDEVPLGYLDWLSGQSYVNYGWLRTRLTQYLTRPQIQRALYELFPDPDDDSFQPVFIPSKANQQRREPMPKEFMPTLDPEDVPLSYSTAYDVICDAIEALETMTDPNDWLELDRPRIANAVQVVANRFQYHTVFKLREAYRTCKLRLQALHTEAQPHEEDFAPKPRRGGKRIKALKVRRRRLNHALAIVSIEEK